MKFIHLIIVLLISHQLIAQSLPDTATVHFFNPSLNDLSEAQKVRNIESKVSVASFIDVEKNEAPGVISTITSQEIEEMGARDLVDVLNTVPGFNLASDVQNGLAFGIRGNWTEEGKMLYMVDGIPMNELGYGTYVVGDRFPISSIERIEIIRGAGSAIYGGLAGLGVVNIITKGVQNVNGHKLYVNNGFSKLRYSKAGLNYLYGGTLLNGTELSINTLYNFGNRSNNSIVLPDTTFVNFKDSSKNSNQFAYIKLKKENFQFRHLFEDYNFQSTYEPITSNTKTLIEEVSYTYIKNKFSITPILRYKWQLPWNTDHGNPILYEPLNIITRRSTIQFNANYLFNPNLNLTFGSSFYNDGFKYFMKSLQTAVGKKETFYNGISFFSELYWNAKITKIFLGVRFDNYAFFKPFWAPRLTITKSYKKIFYKALGNVSYKLPTLQNILSSNNYDIKPEVIKELQFQLGYTNSNLEISATTFLNKLDGLIVYFVDSLQNESYQNKGLINTRGFEFEAKIKFSKFKLTTNYSIYQPFNSTAEDVIIDLTSQKKGTYSFPVHKVFLGITYTLNPTVSLNLFDVIQSKRTFATSIDANDAIGDVSVAPTNLINTTVQFKNLLNNRVKINFGIYNVLNSVVYNGYAYKAGYKPLIAMGREFFFLIRYNI